MSDLPAAVVAELTSLELVAAVLVEMDFDGGAVRVWNGPGQLTAGGETWEGVGQFGAISEIEESSALDASGFTLELCHFGEADLTDESEFIAAFQAALDQDVFGRAVRIYLQVFDVDTNAAIGAPQAVASARMVHVEADWQSVETAAVRIQCEHVLAWARMAPAAYLTDADQQARHPGDLACELTTVIPTREVTWPRD